jgi:hypothetical protein
MNNMNTPKPIEPSIGARYEIDSFLSDICIHICVANLPTHRPDIKSPVEMWFKGIAEIVVQKSSEAD